MYFKKTYKYFITFYNHTYKYREESPLIVYSYSRVFVKKENKF